MELLAVELLRVSMPLVAPFRTSLGTETLRDILLLRVEADIGTGWGECCAPSEPVYSAEYVDGCDQVLRRHLLPRLFAAPCLDAVAVAGALRPVAGHRMAKAALEMAILDAELRARGESFAQHLGATRTEVECGVALGIHASVPELLSSAAAFVDQGYRRIKLKIEPGWDLEPVRAVRERWPEIALQVDANAAYTLADAGHLAALDAFDLLLIEQPLPPEQVLAHAQLARMLKTPICLDETIISAAAAADAIALGACAIVNVKPSRVGGYLEARRIHDVCAAHGVPVWCGGMHETGLGRAGNLALAALPGFTLPGDISASHRYYQRDVTPPFEQHCGRIQVPSGPGLGVDVDMAFLDSVTTHRETLRP